MQPQLKEKIRQLPQKPGVYIFKGNYPSPTQANKKTAILYIGKAAKLRQRVLSYWREKTNLTPAKQIMLAQIKDLDFILTDTETEALLLETTLIKKHHPPFNIVMRDDKDFAFIKINLASVWPEITYVRRPSLKPDEQIKYFGPYPSAKAVKETIKLVKRLFPICSLSLSSKGNKIAQPLTNQKRLKPCWQYQLKRCLGACVGKVNQEEYRKIFQDIIAFLQGRVETLVENLYHRLEDYAKNLEFEKAAKLRDQIRSLEKILEKQKMISRQQTNFEVISLYQEGDQTAIINLFVISNGKLIEKQNFILEHTLKKTQAEIIQAFLEQYYSQKENWPKEIIIPCWFNQKTKAVFKIPPRQTLLKVPRRGLKKELIHLGTVNARLYLKQKQLNIQKGRAVQALKELQKVLQLPSPPSRLEAYDISNIQGYQAVGSMVVFIDGLPDKNEYRRFIIKSVKQINDPAMIKEIIQRRFAKLKTKTQLASVNLPLKDKPRQTISSQFPALMKWQAKPDLIIIDGGRTQLNAAAEVLKSLNIELPLISLAKREEKIYTLTNSTPIKLPAASPALRLLQHIRDEAHRFAITFYRRRHRQRLTLSKLDEIPGLGQQTKKKLLQHFGSLANLKKLNETKLAQIIGPQKAQRLKEYL